MAHLRRQELKQKDELEQALDRAKAFFSAHGRELLVAGLVGAGVLGAVGGLSFYTNRQKVQANLALGHALKIFHGFVGSSDAALALSKEFTFSSQEEKYRRALDEFSAIFQKYPKLQAGWIARYYMGLCQSQLHRPREAVRTLEQASQVPDPELRSLARFALAGEKLKEEELAEADKIYQDLMAHPTRSLSRPMVELARAESYRSSRPEEAKKVYQRLEQEFSQDPNLASALKSASDSLSQ